MHENNFIEKYLDFYSGTEPPTIFNRWCAISGISTVLGRQCWVQHGHSKIYPNQYIMLVGESGTRKSTAIKEFLLPILKESGYHKIAADKTSKEKFLMDLAQGMDNVTNTEDHLDVNSGQQNWGANKTMRELFGVVDASEPAECLIMADEFNLFMGHNNVEFIDLLTALWSYSGLFSNRTKTGKSILVPNPTLNGLFGNTQIGISQSFPIEVIGQGFFSRLVQIYSDPSGRRITRPPSGNIQAKSDLVRRLLAIKGKFRGEILIPEESWKYFDEIYQPWKELEDVRFKSYSNRRLTHLIKLCMCVTVARDSGIILPPDIEYANSILHYAEFFMPKALGEFGKARQSDVSAKILEILEKADKPLHPINDLYPLIARDLDSTKQLADILGSMKAAGKIQQIASGGVAPKKAPMSFNFPHCKPILLREYQEQRLKDGMPL